MDGPALPSRQTEEPLLFQLALASARDSIRLLWPRADHRGRETPRSAFADEAARALGLTPSDGTAADLAAPGRIVRAPLAAVPELSACRSPDEFLARASLDAIADPAFRALAPAPRERGRALIAALARSPLRAELFAVARSSLAERERLGAFVGSREPGRFSGQLSGRALEAARPLFAYGADFPLSASLLEEEARCSFKLLGHRVLGVTEQDSAEEDLPSRERGTLLHRCLEAFYSDARARNRLPITEPRPVWSARLKTIAEEEMDRFARSNDAGHRGLWRLRKLELLRLLEEVVAEETALDADPLELERNFGGSAPDSWEPLRIPSPDGSDAVFVRGAIDRVDTTADSLLVLDYKYSRSDGLRRKLRPEFLFAPEFQLVIYAAALRAKYPARKVDATFLSLRDANRTPTLSAALGKGARSIDDLLELDPARRAKLRNPAASAADNPPPANLADQIWARVSRLRLGLLPVESIDCERCDLKPVCRIAALPVDEEELR